jgi:hypothetical protein
VIANRKFSWIQKRTWLTLPTKRRKKYDYYKFVQNENSTGCNNLFLKQLSYGCLSQYSDHDSLDRKFQIEDKSECKFAPYTPQCRRRGIVIYPQPWLEMEVSAQRHAPVALHPTKNSGKHWNGGWICPSAGTDVFWHEQVPCELHYISGPFSSQASSRTNYTTLAEIKKWAFVKLKRGAMNYFLNREQMPHSVIGNPETPAFFVPAAE